nr:immunoglobulin light chain junction region [Macaca mulatta]
CQHYDTTPYSF